MYAVNIHLKNVSLLFPTHFENGAKPLLYLTLKLRSIDLGGNGRFTNDSYIIMGTKHSSSVQSVNGERKQSFCTFSCLHFDPVMKRAIDNIEQRLSN